MLNLIGKTLIFKSFTVELLGKDALADKFNLENIHSLTLIFKPFAVELLGKDALANEFNWENINV